MTDGKSRTGAASHGSQEVPPTPQQVQAAEGHVRRLQARIVKAQAAGRWNQAKALQHLLTHSQSGRILAVARVSRNDGKHTPGVDGET
jgi:retron-type reverse transcriptase